MTNKEHCKATEVISGLKPHLEMHLFMDGFYQSMGWGHRTRQHDYKIINTMADLYGEDGGLEAGFPHSLRSELGDKGRPKVMAGDHSKR